jgi:hypothetical protein
MTIALAFASPSFADSGDEAGDVAAARNLAVEGMKLAQSGKCEDAIDKLERAEKLHHAPIVLGKLGECYVQQGRLVEGTEALRKMLREPLPSKPTPAIEQAYEHAQATLDATTPKLAGVTVTVRAASDADVTTKLDGKLVSSAQLGVERPLDPGEHVLEASAPGFIKAEKKIVASAGDKLEVSLELERDPNAPAKSAAAAEPVPETTSTQAEPVRSNEPYVEASTAHAGPNHTAAYVAWTVGAIGLGVGAGFGIAAWSGKKKLDDACSANVCPPNQSDRLDSAKLEGQVATIGLGVAAVGAILGTTLFFAAGSGSSERAATTAAPRKHADARPTFVARPFVGFGSAGLSGEF